MIKQFKLKNIVLNGTLVAFILFVILSKFQVNAYANTKGATDLTKSTTIQLSSGEDSSFLKDQNSSTKKTINGQTSITIKNDSGINGIYIIWEQTPGEWTLEVNGTTVTYGKYGFLHEYIKLDATVKSAVIKLPASNSILADISTFSDGELPSWVQVWNPPYEVADLLVLPTHADDEHIFFGGTMPYYGGELGLKVQVVYLTNHLSESYRLHELLNGLWEVGITAYPITGPFKDFYSTNLEHAKKLYPIDDVIGFQVEMIRRFKPKVIVAHDFNGEYGHGVHRLNTYTLSLALEISNNPGSYPVSAEKYGIWDVPKTYVHLYEQNQITMNWDISLDSFNGATGFQMAERGFAKHKSQQGPFYVGREGVYNCMLFGLYRTTVGKDIIKNDFFENIKVFRSYKNFRKSNIIPKDFQLKNNINKSDYVVQKSSFNSAR